MARRGFGQLIAERRTKAGLSPEQLAERLGRSSKSIVYRLEAEEQEPSADDINVLTSALPMSAEELLRAMGVFLTAPAAAKLPRSLTDLLVQLGPEYLRNVERAARGQLLLQREEQRTEGR